MEIALMDHELTKDELAWTRSVYADFVKIRASSTGRDPGFHPREALREVLGRNGYRLEGERDLSGPGPWRLGRNRHGRGIAAVFLHDVELHQHQNSRTDQFPIYVIGEADGFSLDAKGDPVLTPVTGGDHFHNAPGAPHAFVPRGGTSAPANWEIAFLAITPRNLREDTQAVSHQTRASYKRAVGMEAPHGA